MPQASPKKPNATDIHVGQRIRMRRMELGVAQTALAEAIGVTFQQVQKYERASNRVNASRLQQIANALDVPISFFFHGAATKPPHQPEPFEAPTFIDEFLFDRRGIEIARLFVGTTDALRNALLAVAEKLSECRSKEGE
jgi:transcriptional regulator with XRE-family HTH domain